MTITRSKFDCHYFFLLFLVTLLSGGCQGSVNDEYQLLHQGQGIYNHPVWSPGGNQVLYMQRPGEQFIVLDLDDNQEKELLISTEGIAGPTTVHWPTDDTISYSLSYTEETGRRVSRLATYSLNENKEHLILSDGRIYEACWSEPTESYVFVMRVPFDRAQVYGNVLVAYNRQDESVTTIFRADRGERIIDIACDRVNGVVTAVVLEGETGNDKHTLIVSNIQTGGRKTVFETTQIQIDSPTLSPDGDWIAVRSTHGKDSAPRRGIMLISVPEGETRVVVRPGTLPTPWNIAWSPVDNRLLIRASAGFPRQYALYTLDLTPWLEE